MPVRNEKGEKKMKFASTAVLFLALFALAPVAQAHCQIPCGIFADQMRFEQLQEDIVTIDKSIKEIVRLSKKDPILSLNQIVRWINNKETHANKIMDSALHYFLAQRVKLPANNTPEELAEYHKKLALLHEIIVYSMRSKQSLDLANTAKLTELLEQFRLLYFGKEGIEHLKNHKHHEGK